jgi:hypothetical protein
VNTLTKPRSPIGSEPSSDDDPTGVRALLSSLPEPDPMPAHLVERINASLAAEQARRTAQASDTSVTPLLARAQPRRGRLVFAIAGAAAAIALAAIIGNNMFPVHHSTAISGSAAVVSTASGPEAAGGAQSPGAAKAPALAGRGTTPSLVQIGHSGIRYTRADFVAQVQTLRTAPFEPMTGESSSIGPAGTAVGLTQCLSAIGATEAQVVRADVAFYEGHPAVIIVATTNGQSTAYAVGRQCSQTDPAELRTATRLS